MEEMKNKHLSKTAGRGEVRRKKGLTSVKDQSRHFKDLKAGKTEI